MSEDADASKGVDAIAPDHQLSIVRLELVGGGRVVEFNPGLNIITGDITTGKTTFVRLIRSLLGTVPDNLPPEAVSLRGLRGLVRFRSSEWQIFRRVVTTATAPVDVSRVQDGEDESFRLPASGVDASFSRFLLERLRIPVVSVPRARTSPLSTLSPVSATDWLGYCVIPGDELDTSVFGHGNPFRDQKRKWVFELAYGVYDTETARLAAQLRTVELRLETLDSESEVISRFLADTPFANRDALMDALRSAEERVQSLDDVQLAEAVTSSASVVGTVRLKLLERRERLDQLRAQMDQVETQLEDLQDLLHQLGSQSARITRAIVADEWLVDFDFLVCPRCGNDVTKARAEHGHCYLCLQPDGPSSHGQDSLLAEQDRLVSQIAETREVIESRESDLVTLETRRLKLEAEVSSLARQLDVQTAVYVSDNAAAIRANAEASVRAAENLARVREYLVLVDRFAAHRSKREDLLEEQKELQSAIDSRSLAASGAEENIRALERKLYSYLADLHIPQLGELLSVSINRKTYLPEVSGRTFDELSSQGLKTLVNVAHALAHHTTAIDRGLPLPGLLVLDGLSANAGTEGFDRDRTDDLYRLLLREVAKYSAGLQVVAVDNNLPTLLHDELSSFVILALSQNDRLVRSASIQLDAPS